MFKTAFLNSFLYKLLKPFIDSYEQSACKRGVAKAGITFRNSAFGRWVYRFTYEKEPAIEKSLYRRILDKIGGVFNKISQPLHNAFEKPAEGSSYFSNIKAIASSSPQDILAAIFAFFNAFFWLVAILSLITGGKNAMIFGLLGLIFCGLWAISKTKFEIFEGSFFITTIVNLLK